MAKATLTLPDGTVVTVTGSMDEVASIMAMHGGGDPAPNKARPSTTKKKEGAKPKRKPKSKAGPKQRIQGLVDAGYFKQRRSIVDIQAKLEEEGHIYAQTSISPALVRLTRERALGRVKHGKMWAYVNP